eukprot:1157912-Pelagomonas_calceolata.AAC.7
MALGESVAFSMSLPPASTNCSRSGQKSMRWIYKIWHCVKVLHFPRGAPLPQQSAAAVDKEQS